MKRIVLFLAIIPLLISCAGDKDSSSVPSSLEGEYSSSSSSSVANKQLFGESFSFSTLSQETLTQDIFSEYDLTMVNCWATWCGPCVSEIPSFQGLYEALPEGVNLITVCLDSNDSQALKDAQTLMEQSNAKYQTVVVTDDSASLLSDDVMYLPTTFFLDKNGCVVGEAFVGVPSGDDVVGAYIKEIEARLSLLEKKDE